MAPMYYRGAKGAILVSKFPQVSERLFLFPPQNNLTQVFDVTKEETFSRLTTWLRDLRTHADPDAVICIAANKIDRGASCDMQKCEAEATKLGAKFYRTSALTGEGVREVFESLTQSIVEIYHERHQKRRTASKDSANTVTLRADSIMEEQKRSISCC
jgi:GTPase SAR1 family protein